MQIKTKIMSKLTDNFYRVLYALSCSFILWIAYAFWNHSQLPRMGKNWSVDLFPIKSKYYPSPPFFLPQQDSRGNHWGLPARFIHVSMNLHSVIPEVPPVWADVSCDLPFGQEIPTDVGSFILSILLTSLNPTPTIAWPCCFSDHHRHGLSLFSLPPSWLLSSICYDSVTTLSKQP